MTEATAAPAAPTTPAPTASPAPTTAPAPTSLVAPAAAPAWAEFVPDQAKSVDENAAAKVAHDATKPAAAPAKVEAPTPVTATDIKLPDGYEIPTETMTEALALVNDPNLTPAQRLQSLLDLQIKSSEAAQEAGSKAWNDTMGARQTEVRNDPTYGGAKFDTSVATANKVVDTIGGAELSKLFAESGVGNSIHLIRFLNLVAPKVLEPTPLPPGGVLPGAGNSQQAAAERMFDKSGKTT